MKLQFPRNNNLEWLRLIFAMQVVIGHVAEHFKIKIPSAIKYFPGVPAFFFVSGFLIYASYLNAPGRRYYENRFLRIFPALVLVTLGGGIVVLTAHGWTDLVQNFPTYVLWFFAQTTFGQAYNPGIFRDVGTGVVNGSLWTITTEIIFYLFVPVIVRLESWFSKSLLVLILVSFLFYSIGPLVWRDPIYRDKTFYDIMALTPIPWGWMFGFGVLVVKNFQILKRWFPYLPLAVVPIVIIIFFDDGRCQVLLASSGNRLGLLYFVNYVALILWFAFSVRPLRLSFDLSYGAYIWHMPVINLLMVLGFDSFLLSIVLTFLFAALSWFFLEKPFLKFKRVSLKSAGDTA